MISRLERQPGGGRKALHYVYVNRHGTESTGAAVTFPADVFDRAVFSRLRELDPREILPGANGHDEVMALEGEQGLLEASLAALSADMDLHGESPGLLARYRTKEARLALVRKALPGARHKAANPLSQAWGEAKSLLDVLDAAPDPEDARTRLRSALRRIVAEVWVLVVPRGHARLCACQIYFAADKEPARRGYLILNVQARGNGTARTEGSWRVCSLADAGDLGDLDLRDRDHVAKAEAGLLKIDVAWLAQQLGGA
jgi:hypothetical protein